MDIIDEAIQDALGELAGPIPGEVVSFDATSQLVSVKPAIPLSYQCTTGTGRRTESACRGKRPPGSRRRQHHPPGYRAIVERGHESHRPVTRRYTFYPALAGTS